MAKVTKAVLKSIVKECLVEILSEGLSTHDDTLLESNTFSPRKKQSKQRQKTLPQKRPALDAINYNQQVDTKVAALTSDPIMSEIFKDTAMTTLMEQRDRAGQGNFKPADTAAQVSYDNDPTDLFAGGQNWAALAFSGPTKK